jgi:hypothetical protein
MPRPYLVVRIGGVRFTNERAEAIVNHAALPDLIQTSKDALAGDPAAKAALRTIEAVEFTKGTLDPGKIGEALTAADVKIVR